MLNQENIIRMAREAGFDISKMAREAGFLCEEDWAKHGLQKFERFANLVAAHEREKLVQVQPLEFVEAVLEKEHLVGKPLMWAQWPNEEKK